MSGEGKRESMTGFAPVTDTSMYASSTDPVANFEADLYRGAEIHKNKFNKAIRFAENPKEEALVVGHAVPRIRNATALKALKISFATWANLIYPACAKSDDGTFQAQAYISKPEFEQLKAKYLNNAISSAETTMLKSLSEPGLKLVQKLMGGSFTARTHKKMRKYGRKLRGKKF